MMQIISSGVARAGRVRQAAVMAANDSPNLSTLTVEQLLDAYEATSGEPSGAEGDFPLAEIQRRGLDV